MKIHAVEPRILCRGNGPWELTCVAKQSITSDTGNIMVQYEITGATPLRHNLLSTSFLPMAIGTAAFGALGEAVASIGIGAAALAAQEGLKLAASTGDLDQFRLILSDKLREKAERYKNRVSYQISAIRHGWEDWFRGIPLSGLFVPRQAHGRFYLTLTFAPFTDAELAPIRNQFPNRDVRRLRAEAMALNLFENTTEAFTAQLLGRPVSNNSF